MRFVTAVAEKDNEGEELVERVSRELWKRIWSNDQDIIEPASFTEMLGSQKVIKLFYDVASPYSWLAFEALCRYKNVWNINLIMKPAYLAGVIQGSGNQSPVLVPNKFWYAAYDLKLQSEYFGVPWVLPSDINKGTLNAMRFVTAVAEKNKEGEELVERVSRELWKRKWSTDQDIIEPASLTEVGIKAGLSTNEVEEILTLAKSEQIKVKLKSVTDEALKYKCFGLPLIVCQVNGKDRVFFGSDRFELMAYFLGEKWVGPHPTKPTVTV